MSAPSSEGRPSVSSSEPSVASSHTLNSKNSRTYADNGEGSSQRPSLGSRHDSSAGSGAAQAQARSRNSSPLVVDSIEEQDFAHRRQRNRRSGGFLLDSTFSGGPRARHSYHAQGGMAREEHGSPLSQQVRMVDRDAVVAPEQRNEGLRISKTRDDINRIPSPSHDRDTRRDEAQPRPMIDPNHIVHMALNLSESRRRNLSAGQLLVPQPRVASSGIQRDGSFRNHGPESSLRQYFNEQRRASRNISPGGIRTSSSGMRHVSASMQRSGSLALQAPGISITDATRARCNKFRAYIELKIEYLRLLECLPPLKPDANAPGNFIFSANSVPGSPHPHLTRTPSHAGKQHELGRPYNPLQYIRNRRTRARERKALDHAPEEFLDIDQVRDWVDRVESASGHSGYRQEDAVSLPKFYDDHQREAGPSKPSRPHMGWVLTPEELLADAHWLEQEDNKTVIEDRYGHKIFPPKEPPKQDFLSPRESKEYADKRRRSWVESVPGISTDPATGDESEHGSERGRRRRLLPAFRSDSPKHKKHDRKHSRPQSSDSSSCSDSDSSSKKHRARKPRRIIDVNNNTGPLELKIKELMEQEAKEAQAKSPAVVSPDTPNKWGREHITVAESKPTRNSLEVPRFVNGSARSNNHWTLNVPTKSQTDTNVPAETAQESRSSFEDLSTAPNSPLHPKPFPHIGSDLSPPPSRAGSMSKIQKKSKLDIFRADESTKGHKHEYKHDHKQEPDSATSDKQRASRQASEEVSEGNGLGAAIFAAPGAVKSLLGHRKNDSASSLHSPDKELRKDIKESKDPASAVHRFFKGVKNEGSKVGEFIFRRDRPVEDSDTDTSSDDKTAPDSDTEDSSKRDHKFRPTFARSTTAGTTGSAASKRISRYHLELPSFRSQNQLQNDENAAYASDSYLTDNHIARQARDRANNRSSRFEKLAPPRMDLRSISAASTPGTLSPIRSHSQERINRVLARPGGVGQGGLPVTALRDPPVSEPSNCQRSTSRPTLEGKRHWSITDDDGNVLHRKHIPNNIVTTSDIARIRALFLCSGVKAKEIARRAHAQRSDPPAFLTRAAKTANTELIPVPRKEEHVLAARILVRKLESSTQALHSSAEDFRENTVKELSNLISSLKSKVESEIFPRVREGGDEAVRITSEVSGSAPLAVKQVSDEIDKMLRVRRRRMRWVRRVGWTLVEWMLLGAMWWAWLIVFVLGLVRRVFGFGWGVVRWLLWV